MYNSCPGPIDPAEKERFRAHGLYLRSAGNQRSTLYAVHHGGRESIEVFELDARAKPPTLTWVGCAIPPDPIGLNSWFPCLTAVSSVQISWRAISMQASAAKCWRAKTMGSCGNGAPEKAGRRCRAAKPPAPMDWKYRRTGNGSTLLRGQPVVLSNVARPDAGQERQHSARFSRGQYPLGG